MGPSLRHLQLYDNNTNEDVTELSRTIIASSIVLFGILGLFGNVNIIFATNQSKALRSKCGLLLAISAFCDLSCVLFELLSAFRLFTGTSSMSRSSCFWSISYYLFVLNIGNYMRMLVGFDRLLAICIPIKYMLFQARHYVPIALIPGIVFSIVFLTLGAIGLDDVRIQICYPPAAYPDRISNLWNMASMVSCGCTVIFYVATYIMLYKVAPQHSAVMAAEIRLQKVIITTLTVNVIAYVCSFCLSVLIVFLGSVVKVSENAIKGAEYYAIIPAVLCYSTNYYVYFWRSSEYRRAFKRQLNCYMMFRKTSLFKKVTRVDTQVISISRGPHQSTVSRY